MEAYTPYAIHGIEEALGLRRSPLGGMVLVMGVLGAITAFGFEYWISAIDYPIITGGKAPNSWEAFIPIMFEVTVLFATFTAGLGMLLLLNKLPFFGHPVLSSKSITGITRDRFALAIEAENGSFDSAAAARALQEAGALEIEVLPAPDRSPFLTSDYILRTLGGIFAACLVAGLAMFFLTKWFPLLAPMRHMQDQPRLDAQKPSSLLQGWPRHAAPRGRHRGPRLPAHGHRNPGAGGHPGESPAPHQGGLRHRPESLHQPLRRSAMAPSATVWAA